jgi:hypothetical protein
MEWRTEGDTAYRSAANEAFMEKNGCVSRVHRKKPNGGPMPEATSQRRQVEDPRPCRTCFRRAERPDGPLHPDHRHRQATMKVGLANLAYNIKRLIILQRAAA